MKRSLLILTGLVVSIALSAQEEHSQAYKIGYITGWVVGILAVIILFIWLIRRVSKK